MALKLRRLRSVPRIAGAAAKATISKKRADQRLPAYSHYSPTACGRSARPWLRSPPESGRSQVRRRSGRREDPSLDPALRS